MCLSVAKSFAIPELELLYCHNWLLCPVPRLWDGLRDVAVDASVTVMAGSFHLIK